MVENVDVVIDLQSGDTGKGKIAHALTSFPTHDKDYDYALRFNGGGNAGHTIYHNGQKVVTHQIPVGIMNGVPSIIGPGCVVNLFKLEQEINELKKIGVPVDKLLMIDKRAHVVTGEHMSEDFKDTMIGTTKQGIGPAYRDKYSRSGIRFGDMAELTDMRKYIVDVYDIFYSKKGINVLAEGAQGFNLDIDWGDYPFVTTSHCTVGSVFLNGIAPQALGTVYGVMKAYETYVGSKEFEPTNEPNLKKLRDFGSEFGSTTGRPRQCNWLDLKNIKMASHINGATHIIINKLDILEEVGIFSLYDENGKLKTFPNSERFTQYVEQFLYEDVNLTSISLIEQVIWSRSPTTI
jgi:adenylosuccinate synthase